MPAVSIDGLVVRYGPVVAVDHLSCDAPAGAVTALLGPNGAGKTSTVDVATGQRRPDGGSVRVLGRPADDPALRTLVGVMPQDGGVHPGIRVAEALRLYAAFHASPRDPDELLARVGLEGRSRATYRSLSGGEQQRLSLALALVGRPQVVFLDEPTAGVDVTGRQLVRSLIGELRDDGVTVVLTTHELAEAEQVADHVVIVDRGRVVAAGTLDELLHETRADVRFAAAPGLDIAALGQHLNAGVTEVAPGSYVVSAPPDPVVVAAITAWLAERDVALGDLQAGRRSLEDVFLGLTADPQ